MRVVAAQIGGSAVGVVVLVHRWINEVAAEDTICMHTYPINAHCTSSAAPLGTTSAL